MNLKKLIPRQTLNNLSRISRISPSSYPNYCKSLSTITAPVPPPFNSLSNIHESDLKNARTILPFSRFRYIHSTRVIRLSQANINPKVDFNDSEEDGVMNEFLSRFVWIMRGKLSEVYSDCDKQTMDGMLLIIVGKVVEEMEKGGIEHLLGSTVAMPSQDFSEDLWATVWEVSNMVLKDMENASKKEKMKRFLQSEEVKEMCRFAGESGIRGELLRELRFKWAREKMEEREFYESLERLREKDKGPKEDVEAKDAGTIREGFMTEDKPKVVSLPKRKGKIKYKIYGLDLSDPKWTEVAEKINEAGESIWPKEPKPITGRCKQVMEKILSLKEEDDPSSLLAEWIELLHPSRVDWMTLLENLEQQNFGLYLKVAEHVLGEESFQTNVRDYTKLIDAYAKADRTEDAERILKKMAENGILPDILTCTALVHMYSKAGNIDRAKEAFDNLRSHGFRPDLKVYNSMIMAYVNAGQAKLGESLVREMETKDIKPTQEIYMALLRSFARSGDVNGAARISNILQFGFQPTLESRALLVEAYGQAGNLDQARNAFDHIIKLGLGPDDRCTASMIAAYEKKNLLGTAVNLLMQLEKDGFEPGCATYTVLVDWLGKLQLVDEAEQLLGRIAVLGEVPPLKLHVSLCDMYSRAKIETKALQALGVLESKKDELGPNDFEKIVLALASGSLVKDAQRVVGMMEARGFAVSDQLKMTVMASETFNNPKGPTMK